MTRWGEEGKLFDMDIFEVEGHAGWTITKEQIGELSLWTLIDPYGVEVYYRMYPSFGYEDYSEFSDNSARLIELFIEIGDMDYVD